MFSDPLEERTFEPDKTYLQMGYLGICFFGGLALLSCFLPVISNDGDWPNTSHPYQISLIFFVIFCGFVIFSYSFVRRLRNSAVTIDGRGLWSTKKGKENSFVRWESIKTARDRVGGGRIDLIGSLGETLIQIQYQLSRFEELRDVILSKFPRTDRPYPQRYRKQTTPILFAIGIFSVFVVGISWCYSKGHFWLTGGLLAVSFIAVRDFLRVPLAIVIWQEQILLKFPLGQLVVQPTDVKSVAFDDYFVKGDRVVQLVLRLANGKSINMSGLTINEIELHRELIRFKAG